MTQYVINIGTVPNDGTGDPLRTAFNEVNLNFDQVFEAGPVGSNVQIANNTILTTNTNGNLVLAPNGIGVVQANVNIVPNTSNTRNLGSSSRRWSELYVQYANISSGLVVTDLTATGNVTVAGNLSVSGNIINVANIITDAKTIQLANTAGTANAADGSGITVGANDAIATFLFNSANTVWATNIGVQVGGPITGTSLAVSDAIIYGNTTGINALFTGTVTTPNIVVNNITSDDSTFVTIQDGLDVNGDIETENITVNGTITTGNIVPRANVTYSLGNSSLWWSNVWVAGNTIYIGGVPLGMAAGNVLTVGGNAVLQNDSNTTISTTGNITADYFFGNGSQLTGLNTSSISNGTSNVDIATANGNVTVTSAGTYTWTFGSDGNLTLPGGYTVGEPGGPSLLISAPNTSDAIQLNWAGEVSLTLGNTGAANIAQIGTAGGYWEFDQNALLKLPGGNVAIGLQYGSEAILATNTSFGVATQGNATTFLNWSDDVANTSALSAIYVNDPTGNVGDIAVRTGNVGNAHVWSFGVDGNLKLPSEGNIVGITPNNSGHLQWVGNSSGDGFGFTTLQLVPDSTLSSEQCIIVDPTGPNHIHLRAGGTQDDSAAQLYLGGENSHFKVDNGLNPNVYAAANSYKWTFGSDGNLTLPGDNVATAFSRITSLANSSGDGAGYTTLGLIPDINLTSSDQYLIIDPTAPGHIHIRAGGTQDNSSADLFLGGENSHVKIAAGANSDVVVRSNSNNWTFDTLGVLTLPGEGVLRSIGDSVTLQSINVGSGNANSVYLGSSGGLGFFDQEIGGNWLEIFRSGAEPEIRVPVGRGNLNIQTAQGNTAYNWTFDNTGNFNAPGAISAVGNITGNYIIGNGNQLTNVNAVTVDVTDTNGLTTIYYPTFVENRANAQIARADVDLTYRTDDNLLTVGNVSVTGNVTGNYFIGNGSQLTGLPAGYANSDVANFMAAFGSNSISTTGNVTANNISGNILVTGNVTGTTPNVTLIAGSYSWTFDNTGNTAFANGTITAGNISATGAVFGERLISTLSVGNEGGQINLSLPAANTTLTTSVTLDSFQDRFRVFETGGTNRGMYIDLNTSPAGGAAIGYRDIPQVSFTGNATLAASDAGKHYYSTQSTDYVLTIANNTSVGWSVGTAITIVNRGTGNMTIAQGTGVSLYLAGNSTAGNRTVTTYGMATLLNVAANVWMINGTGVS